MLQIVGEYIEKFNSLTGQHIPCGDIYQSNGLSKHILKRHPARIGDIDLIPTIIAEPDYIGKNPKEPQSIELVKCLEDDLMVCVKLDVKHNYLYVASFFEISEAKLANRITSGRLVKFS